MLLLLVDAMRREEPEGLLYSQSVHRFTSQVVFSDPYMKCDMNRWTSPELDEAASALRTDVPLRLNASRLKEKFMTSCEV